MARQLLHRLEPMNVGVLIRVIISTHFNIFSIAFTSISLTSRGGVKKVDFGVEKDPIEYGNLFLIQIFDNFGEQKMVVVLIF